ncbi:hypothetical protein CLV70_14916 [Pseudosporangium ferrugineum]|uniref:Uncharacterized protein n=1 Tax=Pseudosporangium ferrugineum TaxID=439699 RepID=A0A2T0R976_9ACTN|nr:hypothetical protein CLV70_14916 [Pseudosporangium ferrugineum]
MRTVDVQTFDEDGRSLDLTDPVVSALWPRMPITRLHNGQSLYLTLNRSIETPRAVSALIRWHDGRSDQQIRSVDLSYHRVKHLSKAALPVARREWRTLPGRVRCCGEAQTTGLIGPM